MLLIGTERGFRFPASRTPASPTLHPAELRFQERGSPTPAHRLAAGLSVLRAVMEFSQRTAGAQGVQTSRDPCAGGVEPGCACESHRQEFRLAGSMFRGQGPAGATHKDEVDLALEVSRPT